MAKLSISRRFFDSFLELGKDAQKLIQQFVHDFYLESRRSSMNLEPIKAAKDPRFRSIRISDNYRAILIPAAKGDVFTLLWVDTHDNAYGWAKRHKIDDQEIEEALLVVDLGINDNSDRFIFSKIPRSEMLTIGIPHWMQSKIERIEKIDQLEEMRPFMPPILFVDLFDLLTGKKAEQIIKQRDENKIRYENREYEIMAIILESPNAKKIADKLSRGHIIREKYSIESLVGFDQYEKRSIIYKVKDLDNRFAGFRAIKIFLQDDERTEQIIENELTVRQNIVHENISRCFGLDRFESSGERFLILEYHEGRLLAEFEKYRYINTRELFGYVAQILSGLKRMHEAKFVHGKISPDHIVVDEKNTVKIVSFDNSSISGSDLSFSAGIPNYRPPDFMKIGWHFSWDTYAVGVILYKLLVGRFPDAINPSIPKNKIIELGRDVSEFIEKACQPKRICRFENAGEMLEALGRIKKFKQ